MMLDKMSATYSEDVSGNPIFRPCVMLGRFASSLDRYSASSASRVDTSNSVGSSSFFGSGMLAEISLPGSGIKVAVEVEIRSLRV